MPSHALSVHESQVLHELKSCQRRLGLLTFEASSNVSMLRQLADARFDGSVTELVISALDSLRMSSRIPPIPNSSNRAPDDTRLPPYGKEWATLAETFLNVDHSDLNLSQRRAKLAIPKGIEDYYNCTTTTSSVLRDIIAPDAYGILARTIVGNHERKVSPRIIRAKAAPDQQIRLVTRSLISRHGLNHDSWADALSGQYFLTLLGQRLDLTARQDYQEMLNRFLASFTYRVDDTLTLNERHILVTPQEAEHIRDCMLKEDEADAAYSEQTRHQAANIDISAMHRNYLYGLVLGIAANGGSQVLETVRNLALANLTNTSPHASALDVDGGWTPFRIPWITARIMSSMTLLPADLRDDNVEAILRAAAQSLVDRVLESGAWRSGVGDRVTQWESTGLCLEALLNVGESAHSEVITAVAEYLWTSREEWRLAPSFLDPESSNRTLAACIVSAMIVLASRSPLSDFALAEHDTLTEQQYLADVLVCVAEAGATQPRQFCTIPQVMYYAALAIQGDS